MNKDIKALLIAIFVALALALPFIIHDAVTKQGAFMTTATYREYVRQGKR